jgi:hypothetical protein
MFRTPIASDWPVLLILSCPSADLTGGGGGGGGGGGPPALEADGPPAIGGKGAPKT